MEHPILFRGTMIRAILDGKKTQTRRIIKPQPKNANSWIYHSDYFDNSNGAFYPDTVNAEPKLLKSPYGYKGDYLWVRESLRRYKKLEFIIGENLAGEGYDKWTAQYMATNTPVPYKEGAKEGWCGTALWQWKNTACPSIHMPKWASRITLEITNVRVEQLQDITNKDAMEEGVLKWYYEVQYDENSFSYWSPVNGSGASSKFSEMWNSTNGKTKYSWDNNPWVWVIEFKSFN